MSARVERLLPEPDREEIRRVVAQTERETSAEIVVCVVGESDAYSEIPWRAGVTFALFGGLVAFLWGLYRLRVDAAAFEIGSTGLLVAALACGTAGAILVRYIPALRRVFLTEEVRSRRVRLRAERAFLAEEVFATEGRTGVLLFVSLFERIVCILPDRGVQEAVSPESWHQLSEQIADGIRAGAVGRSLCRAVVESGEILSRHGLKRGAADRNELDDRVRIE